MLFADWRAEAAQIAASMYGIDLNQVPATYVWHLFADGASSWEAAELCRNAIDTQPQRIAAGFPKRVKRA